MENRQIKIGIIGQPNHGKKTLINAINSYFDNDYKYVNFEGNIDYIRNMAMNNETMNTAILVIDVNEGTMPQTREHILYAKQLGVENVVVFLNKCDSITNLENLKSVKAEVIDLLFSYGFDVENISVISGSALKAIEGSSEYKEKIAELMHTANQILLSSEKDVDKPSLHI